MYKLESYNRCVGNPDSRFVSLCEHRKGKFLDKKKNVVSFLHESPKTVRHVDCELIVKKEVGALFVVTTEVGYELCVQVFLNPIVIYLTVSFVHHSRSLVFFLLEKSVKSQKLRIANSVIISSSGVTDEQLQEDLLLAIDKIEKDTELKMAFKKCFGNSRYVFMYA